MQTINNIAIGKPKTWNKTGATGDSNIAIGKLNLIPNEGSNTENGMAF